MKEIDIQKQIAELGEAMTGGFKTMEGRFTNLEDRMNVRFSGVEKRLDNVVDDMRKVKTSVERIETKVLEDYGRRIQRLEELVGVSESHA